MEKNIKPRNEKENVQGYMKYFTERASKITFPGCDWLNLFSSSTLKIIV